MLRVAFIASLLALGLVGMMPGGAVPLATAQEATPAIDCPQTTEAAQEAVARRWFEEALNESDFAAIDEMLNREVTYHSGALGEMAASEVADRVLGPILVGFPDVAYTVERVFTGNDVVTILWSARGTHTGPFQGYAATGASAEWNGINVFRFKCGRVAEIWAEVDGLGRLRQLGIIGTPTP